MTSLNINLEYYLNMYINLERACLNSVEMCFVWMFLYPD